MYNHCMAATALLIAANSGHTGIGRAAAEALEWVRGYAATMAAGYASAGCSGATSATNRKHNRDDGLPQ